MMKKLLIVLVCLGLVVWVISWFRSPEAVATSAAQPWPGGLGTLEQAAARLKPQEANEASKKLTALGTALPKDEALDEFVWREMSHGELTIGKGPAIPDVTPLRELLLREPVVWPRRGGIGGDDDTQSRRVMQLTVARRLTASALVKAQANDPAAWEDLRAVWQLARSMDGQPQVMAQTAGLAMARMINGVAWKMPLPAPAWFAEVQARDHLQPLLEAYQYQTLSYVEDGVEIFPTKMLGTSVEHDRLIAEELVKTTQCDVNVRMNKLGTDLSGVWRRAFRYRAEREATANALRVREGKPIEPKSACSDGTWSFDGTTLRFSREIATGPPDRPMPLTLKVKP
jgi:hypothetical protein